MAVGELIGGAIGILLLVIVAYVLIGSTLSTAEITVSAQRDLTIMHEARVRTSITVTDANTTWNAQDMTWRVTFNVTNSGSETLSTFQNMDVFLAAGDGTLPVHYPFGSESDSTKWNATGITPDFVHPNQLDPGEKLAGIAIFSTPQPKWIEVVTGNGVYSSALITGP
jgi:flagellar protein FlaF